MRRTGRDGFTLIEALVAFAIVAGATMVVQRSLVQSRAGVAQAADRVAPDWLARSLLAEPLSDLDMSLGGRSGVQGGRRFVIRLTPLVDDSEDLVTQSADRTFNGAERQVRWQPMHVSISVEKNQAKWLTVQTVKLGRVHMARPAFDGE
jgi:type II secretory pathway component PulJ